MTTVTDRPTDPRPRGLGRPLAVPVCNYCARAGHAANVCEDRKRDQAAAG